MLSDTDVVEFELETPEFKVKIKQGVPQAVPPAQAAPVLAPAQAAPAPNAAPAPAQAPQADNLVQVTAPMVGTFYRAPAPDAEPYVKVGDIVEVGQPLCIIEAMKLMNEIESETRGRIKEILVENAQPVEYGQPLFIIEKL
nr:acetyl-CoA carboxylase biotin carboxyl carrier protein [Bacillota bacterium]